MGSLQFDLNEEFFSLKKVGHESGFSINYKIIIVGLKRIK